MHALQEVACRDVFDLAGEGKRVDEHTGRLRCPEVAAAAGDSTNVDVALAGKGRHGHVGRRKEIARRGDTQFLAAAGDIGAHRLLDIHFPAAGLGAGDVGNNFGSIFEGLQFLSEELTGTVELFRVAGRLLVVDIVGVSVALLLRLHATERRRELLAEDVVGRSVEDKMMEVGGKYHAFRGFEHLGPVERGL